MCPRGRMPTCEGVAENGAKRQLKPGESFPLTNKEFKKDNYILSIRILYTKSHTDTPAP